MGFIRNLLGGIVELAFNATTRYYDSGMAQKNYDTLNRQEKNLKRMQSSEEQRKRLAEIQAKKEKLNKSINDYDTKFRNNPDVYDKMDDLIDNIKGR